MQKSIKAISKPIVSWEPVTGKAVSSPSDDSKPKYKTLKKKMAQEFKQIHEVLAMNLLPGNQLVQSFIENSALMLSYEKYKGLYDSVYQSAYERFKKAVEAKDLLSTKALYQELDQIKGDCHEKYRGKR